MKYIVYDDGLNENAIVFPKWVSHYFMAANLGVEEKVVGAGFVTLDGRLINCHGKSITLRKSARETDCKIIERMLKN